MHEHFFRDCFITNESYAKYLSIFHLHIAIESSYSVKLWFENLAQIQGKALVNVFIFSKLLATIFQRWWKMTGVFSFTGIFDESDQDIENTYFSEQSQFLWLCISILRNVLLYIIYNQSLKLAVRQSFQLKLCLKFLGKNCKCMSWFSVSFESLFYNFHKKTTFHTDIYD